MENGGLFLLFGTKRFEKLLTGLFTRCLREWGRFLTPPTFPAAPTRSRSFCVLCVERRNREPVLRKPLPPEAGNPEGGGDTKKHPSQPGWGALGLRQSRKKEVQNQLAGYARKRWKSVFQAFFFASSKSCQRRSIMPLPVIKSKAVPARICADITTALCACSLLPAATNSWE